MVISETVFKLGHLNQMYTTQGTQSSSLYLSENTQLRINQLHFLCFISNAVLDRPVDNSQNFDGVAYIA